MSVGFGVDWVGGGSYAGIGSRSTPSEILGVMERLGGWLGKLGWVLRTGGAKGADQAFLMGASRVGGSVELYLPWPGFEGLEGARLSRPSSEAMSMAGRCHPAWERCGDRARALHGRNSHQVLGAELDAAADVVVCWTPDGSLDGVGRSSGGTGQALRIASGVGVRVVNLCRDEHREGIERLIEGEVG